LRVRSFYRVTKSWSMKSPVAPVSTMASVDVSSIVSVVLRWVGIIIHFASISRERMMSLHFIRFSHLGQRSFCGSAGGSAGSSEDSGASSSTSGSVISRPENRLLFSNGAHGSPAAGYKILYTKFLLSFDGGFRGCDILGGELILQFPLQLVRIHVSDVEAEVTLLCPVSSFSATSAGVGSGFGLSCCVYVHRDRIARGRVRVGEPRGGVQPGQVRISPEGGSWTESEGRAVGERRGKPRLPRGFGLSGLRDGTRLPGRYRKAF